jgi:para-aminobenzoate synthetase/4-amino-4-deoxychorismate lyase
VDIFGFRSERPPVATHVARSREQVRPLLATAEAAAHAGRWVAVVVAYDAAPAFDAAMRPRRAEASPGRPVGEFPLAWAAEFDAMSRSPERDDDKARTAPLPRFVPTVDEATFCEQVRRVQSHINAGDTYQVNLTFPMVTAAPPDVHAWFDQLRLTQRAPYAAYLDLGRYIVASLSPELFFEVRLKPDTTTESAPPMERIVRTRPMKGTIRRGRWLAEDEALARALATSRKAQAENVMIVDLLRNDVGRVAETGCVHVPALFAIERYPTLWQMTSTVEGTLRPDVRLPEIFDALFPCGSVTGAPKISTMGIIAALEAQPRGLYTGAVGLLEPGGAATFSVAIRTIVVDRDTGEATMSVGAGITADSVAADEYDECLLKAAFATRAAAGHARDFSLLETMRLEQGTVARLDRHLRRMHDSSRYFGFSWDQAAVAAAIERTASAHAHGVWRLRLTVGASGTPEITCTPHDDSLTGPWRVAFANAPIDSRDPFLFNKTTSRAAHDAARRGRPDVDDVLLWNDERELTESTIANIVVEIDGVRYTPPVACGLLAGTLRGELLDSGAIRERVISRGEVVRAERIWLINSLRGWIEAILVR